MDFIMSEENKESLNEELENTTEVNTDYNVEEAVTKAADTVEEAVEEAVEESTEVEADAESSADEAVADDTIEAETIDEIQAADDNGEINNKKSNKTVGIAVAAAAVVVIIAAVLFVMFSKGLFNKYNRMGYVDVSGITIAEIADESGYELADFLEMNGLPADMPGNTYESVAYYNIPVKNAVQMYGMDFETMKEMFEWGDDITEDSTWGEAEGEIALKNYVGEENLEEFKEQYGLSDEVNGDTKMKEIRNTIDQKSRDDRIASKKAAKNTESATDAPAETEAATEEAPAETDTATEEAK